MPQLELADGFRLYYEVHGKGPAVLLAHGAGGNAMVWWQQVPVFARGYTVISFDHRAFGRSPDVAGGPGRAAFGADALSLLDHLGVERAHVVAHSMGGRTAGGLLRRAPQRVASFTFSGTNGGAVDERARERRAELERDGFFAGSLLRRALADEFYQRSPEQAFLYRQMRALNPPRPRDFLAPSALALTTRGSQAEVLRASGLPILWIVGEHDRVVAPELIRVSHELTPGSRFHVVPGAGHSAYFERAEAWNAAVLTFIDAVEAGTLPPARSD
ncbi:MAG: alpha/beta fold hydrolase [Dehalococcoidia bacterium]|nr:alpha/beta fold hydrolase [Dehalococcoidia bacterium]